MPFDGSGNFTRNFNWQQDRDNGIKILASRMDGECDNFASAFNQTFLRSGIVPMSGNLNMGQNAILGVAAGLVGTPGIRFGDDVTSGVWLNGAGKPTIVAGGTARLEANSAGVAVTGTLTRGGNTVWDAGNFNPALYATLAGPSFTGATKITGATGTLEIQSQSTGDKWIFYDSAGILGIYNNATAANLMTFLGTAVQVTGTLNAIAGLAVNGNAVWHAGNFNSALYAALAGAAFTGGVTGTTLGLSGALTGTTGAFSGAITQAGNQVWHAGNLNPAIYAPLASPALTGTPTSGGIEIGYRDIPQIAKAAAFALDATMRGEHVYYTGAAAAATINTNATTALPVGTAIVIVNDGSGALTLTRAGGVALLWNGTDANRTLSTGGMATLLKVAADRWFVSGMGVS